MSDQMTRTDIVTLDGIGAAERQVWNGFREQNRSLASPYFSLDFVEAVARRRQDTRIAILHRNGTIAGFLPLHLSRSGVARPIGGPLGDHHGLITTTPDLDVEAALAGSGFGILNYHGALADQASFARGSTAPAEISWVSDLSSGYDSFLDDCAREDAKAMRNIRARQRKLAELGDRVVFRLDDRRPDALRAVIETKREQYRRTNALDVFVASWARHLIEDLFDTDTSEFAGMLSTVEIDGQLAAAHFGMRSDTVLHYWFPVYRPEFSKLGPGLTLYLEIARHLADQGVREIHLGPGDYDFKRRLSNAGFGVVGGRLQRPSLAHALVRTGQAIDSMAQALPLGRVSNWPGKAFRRLDRWAAVHAF
ncbi:GNAT family N-acetyltransferase [Maricaulis maris]|uniref:CelD/BcsL family acetyltransferase involved in cellulose biosynthesis n=1 Tax=Maricaulis maris TaxID=74318 RepID=A0A495DMJ7_9PROT|nr:GNAT family N-acetyltransferase [Maricaulis maris]RKR03158.1 CelD/BcsL family acetyltransferase involved in cellulose biosynthesis [Maricaulis maris]